MTRARPKFNLPPRGVTDEEAAGYLGMGPTKYNRIRPQLVASGFPEPDPLTGLLDWKAIERWWDERSGLAEDGGDKGLLARIEEMKNAT